MSGGAEGDLDARRAETLGAVDSSTDLSALDELRVRVLGKSGWLTDKLKALGCSPSSARQPAHGSIASRKRSRQRSREKRSELEQAGVADKLAKETHRRHLAGRGEHRGGLHPVTKVRLRIEQLFRQAGFTIETGPEIEDDFHNFEALNIPADHPARAMHDTFIFRTASCCARTPRRCRSARCSRASRPSR